ncbi:hypothetical protein IAT38_005756 [Cryptococcus sp. DSM 104549]
MTRPRAHPHPRSPSLPLLFTLLTLTLLTLLPPTLADPFLASDPYAKRTLRPLPASDLEALVKLDPPEWGAVDEGHMGRLLIPRASGSENKYVAAPSPSSISIPPPQFTLIQNYISSVFKKLGWHEEKTPFTSTTPIGDIDFTNLIYTFDPDAPRKIVLAAHFDSKWFPDFPANQFIGATDSAAPVALLLSLAEFLTPLLSARASRLAAGEAILRDGLDEEEEAETTVQLVFFDGEEAFKDWTATDSIYGARHLAETWSQTYLPPSHPLSRRRLYPSPTTLNTIDVLVLLDLLGNKHSSILSYFRETDWLHRGMMGVDERLREKGLVEVEEGEEEWFDGKRRYGGSIGDDHVPFLDQGVSVLHVISNPFPHVWHTLADDATALSLPALRRWNRILRIFTCEYLALGPEPLSTSATASAGRGEEERGGGGTVVGRGGELGM